MPSGTMSSFICSPTELLKIRMQLQRPLPGTPGYLGPWGMLRHVVHNEGLFGALLTGSHSPCHAAFPCTSPLYDCIRPGAIL
jgi:hypothetical protein